MSQRGVGKDILCTNFLADIVNIYTLEGVYTQQVLMKPAQQGNKVVPRVKTRPCTLTLVYEGEFFISKTIYKTNLINNLTILIKYKITSYYK